MDKELLKTRSRHLRKKSTETENHLWYFLRDRRLAGYKFRRQVPIGNYIADFVCCYKKLIVELDGSQHVKKHLYDEERTRFLASEGY